MTDVPTLAWVIICLLAGLGLWLVIALVVGLVVAGMTRVRDRQVPTDIRPGGREQ